MHGKKPSEVTADWEDRAGQGPTGKDAALPPPCLLQPEVASDLHIHFVSHVHRNTHIKQVVRHSVRNSKHLGFVTRMQGWFHVSQCNTHSRRKRI